MDFLYLVRFLGKNVRGGSRGGKVGIEGFDGFLGFTGVFWSFIGVLWVFDGCVGVLLIPCLELQRGQVG